MNKIKPISPSLREKKRYIVFEVVSDKKISFNEVSTSVSEECLRFLGELGCAKVGIQILDVWNNQKGIIRVNNKGVNELKSALILIKEINGKNVIIKTKGVSGILKKAKERL